MSLIILHLSINIVSLEENTIIVSIFQKNINKLFFKEGRIYYNVLSK